MKTLIFSLSLSLLGAGLARADDGPRKRPAAKRAPAAKKEAKPVKSYDFLGDDIDGQRIQPDGSTMFGLRNAPQGSLIRLRGHFIPEILKSAEKL